MNHAPGLKYAMSSRQRCLDGVCCGVVPLTGPLGVAECGAGWAAPYVREVAGWVVGGVVPVAHIARVRGIERTVDVNGDGSVASGACGCREGRDARAHPQNNGRRVRWGHRTDTEQGRVRLLLLLYIIVEITFTLKLGA